MVSSGTVSGDSSQLQQTSNNYLSQVEGLSSSWMGSSHDSIVDQSSKFSSEIQQVSNHLSIFGNAVALYETYKDIKDKYNSCVSSYNQIKNSDDQSSASSLRSRISEYESQMNDYATKIKNALSEAASYKLEATSIVAAASTTAGTEATTGVDGDVSATGGQFVADDVKGLYGHIVSSIDGKLHYIYNQGQISGWSRNCNRAAAASIASAYATDSGQAVTVAKQSKGGLGYNSDVTNAYFNQFGLSANVKNVKTNYDNIKNDLVSTLKSGNYVMFDLSESNVKGASGQKWTSERHWLSILDIKRTGSGPNDYAIFVSDSGHRGSTVDHGLGTGWYSIDEFTGQKVENFTTVSRSQQAVAA